MIDELIAQIRHENSDRYPKDQDHQEAAHGQEGDKAAPKALFPFRCFFVHDRLHVSDKTLMFVIDYSHSMHNSIFVKKKATPDRE